MGVCVLICLGLSACVEGEKALPTTAERAGQVPAKSCTFISEIIAKASEADGHEFTVCGRSTAGLAAEFVEEQPYLVEDDSGSLWVITTGAMPEDAGSITVMGEYRAHYQIKGRRFEHVLIEKERS
jgi:hypothetical protein